MATNDTGLTPSERYLGKLCRATFLSLWSYQNVFTDKGLTARNRHGKELCDLLVVFDKHIIIFSDKSCAMPDTGDVSLDWSRWYRRAIGNSADQIFGAERWLRSYPNRIFLDPQCTIPFPLQLPNPAEMSIHRVVVALGAGVRVGRYFGGGSSGSLMLVPSVVGDGHTSNELPAGPFRVGQVNPDRGFIHVFDDITLDIVMNELTTVGDFIDYLTEKEQFFKSGRVLSCAGEEDLLAFYMTNLSDEGKPSFCLPQEAIDDPEYNIFIAEGHWDEYLVSEVRAKIKEMEEHSAFIDKLIEYLAQNILNGTLAYGTDRNLHNHERNIRFLASENRRNRVLMAYMMGQKLQTTRRNRQTSVVISSSRPRVMFVFLLLPRNVGQRQHSYRLERQSALEAYAFVVKSQNQDADFVYGIATEPGNFGSGRSEDFMSFDFREWTAEDQANALKIQSETGILTEVKRRTVFDPANTTLKDHQSGNRKERRRARALKRRRKVPI